jgi:hypothetical protein
MNDASTRFAGDQMGAASLLLREEGNLRVAELAESAVELNARLRRRGYEAPRRANSSMDTAGDYPRRASSSCAHTCRPRHCIPF